MHHTTTIDINDIPTEVLVEYRMTDGYPEILFMTDVYEGSAICPDLLGETNADSLYEELNEAYCDERAEKAHRYALGGWNGRLGKSYYMIEAGKVRIEESKKLMR